MAGNSNLESTQAAYQGFSGREPGTHIFHASRTNGLA